MTRPSRRDMSAALDVAMDFCHPHPHACWKRYKFIPSSSKVYSISLFYIYFSSNSYFMTILFLVPTAMSIPYLFPLFKNLKVVPFIHVLEIP